jgi:hypothetical protein
MRTFPHYSFVYVLLDIKTGCMSIEKTSFDSPRVSCVSKSVKRLKFAYCVASHRVLSSFASSSSIFTFLRPRTSFHCVLFTNPFYFSITSVCLLRFNVESPTHLYQALIRSSRLSVSVVRTRLPSSALRLYFCFWCCVLHRPSDFQV